MRNTHSGHVAVEVHSASLEKRPAGSDGPPPLYCVAEIEAHGRSSTSMSESSGGSPSGGICYEWEEVRWKGGGRSSVWLGAHAWPCLAQHRGAASCPCPPSHPLQSLAFYVSPSDRPPHLKLVLRRPSASSRQGEFVAAGSLGLDPLLRSSSGGGGGGGGGGDEEGPPAGSPRSHQVSVQLVDEVGRHAGAVQATLHVTPGSEGGGEAAAAAAAAGEAQTPT